MYFLNYKLHGTGKKVIVVIGGILSTLNYWERVVMCLPEDVLVVFLEPLGFGHSPKPKDCDYTVEDHSQAVIYTLEYLGLNDNLIFVGYSMGALIAAELGLRRPELFHKLILVSPPVYPDREIAVRELRRLSKSYKMIMTPVLGRVSSLSLRYFKPFYRLILPFFITHVPRKSAQDVVYHSWRSIRLSLQNTVENQKFIKTLNSLKVSTMLVYSVSDEFTNPDFLKNISNGKVSMQVIAGGHQIPVDDPEGFVRVIIEG